MPLPVSLTLISAYRGVRDVVTVITPSAFMASTAFFMRFSITHSSSGALIETMRGCWHRLTFKAMRLDIRAAMYRVALDTAVFTSTGVMAGREPILPNRDAMVDSRFTSLSISSVTVGSMSRLFSSSIHAISDDMGVPS